MIFVTYNQTVFEKMTILTTANTIFLRRGRAFPRIQTKTGRQASFRSPYKYTGSWK